MRANGRDRVLGHDEEAAAFLGLKLGTLYGMVSQRRVPHIRLSSRCVRFEPRTLEAWVSERNVQPRPSQL